MPLVETPRPREPADELGQSRREQWIEFDLLKLAGRRSIRRRLALVRALKHAVGGRTLTDDELDTIIPPIVCRRSRLRSRLRSRQAEFHAEIAEEDAEGAENSRDRITNLL
jgi:hypothetical protein